MRTKFLTQKGTVPIYFKKGRRKPFRLRFTLGEKLYEQYFATRSEALAEWNRLAAATVVPETKPEAPAQLANFTEAEVADYLHWRQQLIGTGLSVADAIRLGLQAIQAPPQAGAAGSETAPDGLLGLVADMAKDLKSLAKRLERAEEGPPASPILRSTAAAARYCGFEQREAFVRWATMMGFQIPKTKLVKQSRDCFLISELNAALLRDPSVRRSPRFSAAE